jgi:predicted aspartyl protease
VGNFYVDCEIVNVRSAKKTAKVSQLLVDTGSECSWISQEVLKPIGAKVEKKDMVFQMANGKTITRSIGYAILRAEGFETIDEVVFAEPGDYQLLGARTLEGFVNVYENCSRKLKLAATVWDIPA